MAVLAPPARPVPLGGAGRRPGAFIRSVLLLLLLGALVATGVTGAVAGVGLVLHRGERAASRALTAPTHPGIAVGDSVRTSYGALTVREAQVDDGLTEEDLGGMTHGVSALVGQGLAQVEVSLTLANTGSRPVEVAAGQFRLVTRLGDAPEGAPVSASTTTLRATALPGRSVVDTRVGFVVPTDGAALWLEYTDPGRSAPFRVALGRTDRIASPPAHEH